MTSHAPADPDTGRRVRIFGPASLSNLGPGYDALGLCLSGLGDLVEAWPVDAPGVVIERGEGPDSIPADAMRNTAGRAALAVLRQAGAGQGIGLRIHKGIPLGSGIGGSSASAVAGAWAANEVLGRPFEKAELVEAVLDGEAVASGSRHGDNVLPALFGGLVLVAPEEPTRYRRIALTETPTLVVYLPKIEILTHRARTMLPAEVPLRAAAANAADLALLVDAFRVGDWEVAGQAMMRDRLVEPVRATLVPGYDAVREAALAAGAFGCALTGSGPALFALVATPEAGQHVLAAMQAAGAAHGHEADGWITEVDQEGVRVI